jgi:hypothetical protein
VKPTQIASSIALLFVVAISSTIIGMKVSQRADYMEDLQKQIKADESRIQVLRTELAYLSSPQRVQALVNLHRPDLATPDSKQYVLNVSDVLPQQPTDSQVLPALVKNASREQADRLIAISLPKATAPVQEPASDSIAQIIATNDIPEIVSHETHVERKSDSLSQSLQVAVQNVAAKDVMGR